MKAAVVIGANYGDEGKGLITDYLANSANLANSAEFNTFVIRFNGGAQAGHTVKTSNGLRHVFSHFASGTFAGAHTYLSEFFIANPVLFVQELKKLKSSPIALKVTIHPDALVTTPYDMYLNQVFENSRGEHRHGSCGVGINETIERNLHNLDKNFQLTVKDLGDSKNLKEKLLCIRDEWMIKRFDQLMHRKFTQAETDLIFSPEILEHFLDDIEIFTTFCHVANYPVLKKGDRVIFEGAQGLLLDQGHKNFPHVTRSNTGLQNVSTIASLMNINHLNVHYVTRCYLTRHGAGPLPSEYSACPAPYFKDETNLPHPFQGTLRFAPLNLDNLILEITADLKKLSKHISKKVTLAVTCLDHFEEKIPIVQEKREEGKKRKIIELRKEEFIQCLLSKTEFENFIFSEGPTREDCKPVFKCKNVEVVE